MPVIARFRGITAKMYLLAKEHNPPHVHFLYGNQAVAISLQTVSVLEGAIPRKALAEALEWTALHQAELLTMWDTQNFYPLPPLK